MYNFIYFCVVVVVRGTSTHLRGGESVVCIVRVKSFASSHHLPKSGGWNLMEWCLESAWPGDADLAISN